MKIVSINGSPKGEISNTNVMIQAIIDGMKSDSTDITNIYLSDKNIRYCKGCYSCWFKTPGNCIINDDMKDIINIMKNNDIIIFGSPLYFNNISGTLKVFFDRLTAMGGDPHNKTNNNEVTPHFIMVSNCGFPYKSQFDVISLWINNIAKMLQAQLIGEFYTTNGKVLTQPTNDHIESKKKYLDYLRQCGESYLNNYKLNDNLKSKISMGVLEF
jgi:multimeric flavodoxin WrbA